MSRSSSKPDFAPIAAGAAIGGGFVALLFRYAERPIAILCVAGASVLLVAFLLFRFLTRTLARRRALAVNGDLVAELDRKFVSGVTRFKDRGKSLYTLPWYILVGEPGAGKTEAIRNSHIGFQPGQNEPAQGRGGTVNMDWWFAKKAILLDTAGRLMFEATDEWRSFLQLLKKHRPISPINGMILAIPAPSLLEDSSTQIHEKASQIAEQLQAVQRELGIRFPIYILITKADLITGFREYFHNLSTPVAQNQILGWSNPADLDEPFRTELLEQHLEGVRQLLKRRQLALLLDPAIVDNENSRRLDQVDAMYAFPNEMMRISARLRNYIDIVTGPNEETDRPLFVRGLYFTSAMTEGAALDLDLANAFGVRTRDLPTKMRVFSRDKTYFLKDFFLDKCFPEGGLVTTARRVDGAWRRRKLAVFSTIIFGALAIVSASVYAQWSLRHSIDGQMDFWHRVNSAQRNQHNTAWFGRVDPVSQATRDDDSLPAPFPSNMTVGDLHQSADALAAGIHVPLIFKIWDHTSGSVNQLIHTAHDDLKAVAGAPPVVTTAEVTLAPPLVAVAAPPPATQPILPVPVPASAPAVTAAPANPQPAPDRSEMANTITEAAGPVATVIDKLTRFQSRESDLFALTSDCQTGDDSRYARLIANWRDRVEALSIAGDDVSSAVTAAGLNSTQTLPERIRQLQMQRDGLLLDHPASTDAIKAMNTLFDHMHSALGTQSAHDFDNNYLHNDVYRERVSAYSAMLTDTLQSDAVSTAKPPALAQRGPMGDKAGELLKAAAHLANVHRQAIAAQHAAAQVVKITTWDEAVAAIKAGRNLPPGRSGEIWQRLGNALNINAARSQLLGLSPADLKALFADDAQKQSNLFLAALQRSLPPHAAPETSTKDYEAFPFQPWAKDRPLLSPEKFSALAHQLSQQPVDSDPADALPESARANFKAIRGDSDRQRAVDRIKSVQPILDTLLAPSSPAHVNIYLLPADQQADIDLHRFASISLKTGNEGEAVSLTNRTSLLLGAVDFPIAGAKATLRIFSKGNAAATQSIDLPGGPWWPVVAVKNGSATPVTQGKTKAWRIRVAIDETSAVWLEFDFDRSVLPEQLWPADKSP